MSQPHQDAPGAHDPISVVVAGGGTAGHIEPALAVAEALQANHAARVTALGTPRGLEKDLVPARGVDLRMIPPVPVPRKPTPALLALPGKVGAAVRATRAVLKDVGADAVIGFGGYVSAPAYLAAASLRIPFWVHEANSKAGMANKLGIRLGGTGLNAVEGSGIPGEVVGVPIRRGLTGDRAGEAAQRGREQWNLDPDRSTVFVTGGSQGAASLNAALAGGVDRLVYSGLQVLHAYGKKNDQPQPHEHYTAVPFIEDMQAAYAVADLIVCRSGAMTVAEVTAAGLPAIYVPLPHGNGEQGLNARDAVAAGAARILADGDLDADRFVAEVDSILSDHGVYQQMRAAAVREAATDVADVIAQRIVAGVARRRGKDTHK